MPRTIDEILNQAQELAARFEDHEPNADAVRDTAALRAVRKAFLTRAEAEQHVQTVLGEHMTSLIAELWDYMRERKKYWLLPILVVMAVLGGLIVLAQGSAVAPFIYTLF